MLEVKLYNVETKEKGTVICEELESHGDGIMCCEYVEGEITPRGAIRCNHRKPSAQLNYYQFDDGTHIVVPASDFVAEGLACMSPRSAISVT